MKKYSKEERELAVELWQESGLSQGLFCKQESIARSTFQNWVKQYGSGPKSKDATFSVSRSAGFMAVNLSSTTRSVSMASQPLTIHYPNGVKITGVEGLNKQELLALIGI